MTRIIKFRVWNGEKMYDDFLVNFPAIGINSLLADMVENAGVLMQSTGLHDKNGKEIYELMEVDSKYRVIYQAPKYVLQDISTGDTIDIYDKPEITGEYSPI